MRTNKFQQEMLVYNHYHHCHGDHGDHGHHDPLEKMLRSKLLCSQQPLGMSSVSLGDLDFSLARIKGPIILILITIINSSYSASLLSRLPVSRDPP